MTDLVIDLMVTADAYDQLDPALLESIKRERRDRLTEHPAYPDGAMIIERGPIPQREVRDEYNHRVYVDLSPWSRWRPDVYRYEWHVPL